MQWKKEEDVLKSYKEEEPTGLGYGGEGVSRRFLGLCFEQLDG